MPAAFPADPNGRGTEPKLCIGFPHSHQFTKHDSLLTALSLQSAGFCSSSVRVFVRIIWLLPNSLTVSSVNRKVLVLYMFSELVPVDQYYLLMVEMSFFRTLEQLYSVSMSTKSWL